MKTLPKVVVVDANFIVALCSPKTPPDDRARIENFIDRVEKAKSKVVFPMVAIAEFLVKAELAAVEFLNTLDRKACIQMADFNRAAAFELAQLDRAAMGSGDKKDESEEPWQKIKTDRQIVATGKSLGAELVISNDKNVRNNALRLNIVGMKIQELQLPESARQLSFVDPVDVITTAKAKAKLKPLPHKSVPKAAQSPKPAE